MIHVHNYVCVYQSMVAKNMYYTPALKAERYNCFVDNPIYNLMCTNSPLNVFLPSSYFINPV